MYKTMVRKPREKTICDNEASMEEYYNAAF
jgi:hypothetical protein